VKLQNARFFLPLSNVATNIEKLKQNRHEKNCPPKIFIGAIVSAIFPKEVKETTLILNLKPLI
jgi:hypothetical protein